MKHLNKIIYGVRILFVTVITVLTIFAIVGLMPSLSKILYLQLGPQLAKLFLDFSFKTLIIVLGALMFTFLFGRFYCSLICPFGLMQDFIGTVLNRKTGKTSNFYKARYLIAFIVFSLLFAGTVAGLKLLDPYTNFSIIVSNFFHSTSQLSLIMAIVIVLIITVLVFFKNRIFCTMICPVGTILGLFSKYGIYQLKMNSDCINCGKCEQDCPVGCIDGNIIDNERCIRCLKCLCSCPQHSVEYDMVKNNDVKFDISKRKFIINCAFAGIALIAVKNGFLWAKDNFQIIKKRPICPPGAESYEKLMDKCISCNLCVLNCKGKVLKSPDNDYNTVHLDFSSGKCEYDCNLCGKLCPTGAIKEMSLKEKQHCKIGTAQLNSSVCIGCCRCVDVCPTEALKFESNGRLPKLNEPLCIGCGACENTCPVNAISVIPLDEQIIIDM